MQALSVPHLGRQVLVSGLWRQGDGFAPDGPYGEVEGTDAAPTAQASRALAEAHRSLTELVASSVELKREEPLLGAKRRLRSGLLGDVQRPESRRRLAAIRGSPSGATNPSDVTDP